MAAMATPYKIEKLDTWKIWEKHHQVHILETRFESLICSIFWIFLVFLLFHSQFPENSSHAKSFHHRSLNRRRPWVVLPPNRLPRLRGHLHPARDRIGRWGCRENPVAASLSGRSVSASPGSYRTLKINNCLDHRNISKQVKTLFVSICLIFLKHCQHHIYHHLPRQKIDKFTAPFLHRKKHTHRHLESDQMIISKDKSKSVA